MRITERRLQICINNVFFFRLMKFYSDIKHVTATADACIFIPRNYF